VIKQLQQADDDFDSALTRLLAFPDDNRRAVRGTVEAIIEKVKAEGDAALVELTNRFDDQSAPDMLALTLTTDRLARAFESIDPEIRSALELAASRVREYHEHQLVALGTSWEFTDDEGSRLGQRVLPMQRVGLYVPGGKAAYPSSVIMTAVPARVAGVEELVLCVPTPSGELNETLLAAAHLAGIEHVFTIGGAQAIAAMAFGSATVPAVDKIVGPGNIYVATAKELVFGQVGIDMIAGPSEVVIIADDSADVDWLIKDMFAQAEHDELAQSIVMSADAGLLKSLKDRLPVLLEDQPRREIIEASLTGRGALILTADMAGAFDIANRIAPEHLQLAVRDPETWLDRVRHAGAVFLGTHTAEVVGDYTAGPSHVLPTSGTARFASPLGIYDFQTRMSLISSSPAGTVTMNRAAAVLAREEGLMAHAASALARLDGQES
jgi:histidinol dehydrogenase